MSINYSFFDDQLIGVDDLNKITSRFVSEGVAREPSSVSMLSGYLSDIATDGVVPESVDSLKVTAENGVGTIKKGTAFFDNGTVIEITEDETFTYTEGQKTYVYLISDMTANKAYVSISESESDNEHILLLAIINEDGLTADKRFYAKGKLAYYANSQPDKNITIIEENIDTKITPDEEGYYEYRIDINPYMYKYLDITDLNGINFSRYNIKDNTFFSCGYGTGSTYTYSSKVIFPAAKPKRLWRTKISLTESSIIFKFYKAFDEDYDVPLSLKFELIV